MTEIASDTGKELIGLDLESRQMVLETVKKLRQRLLTKEKVLEFDKEEIFPEDTIREMLGPEIGLQLLMIPEAYGGMSGGARDSCEITREMSKICLGITTAFFAIQLGADPLMVGGTKAQKEKWLGKIAEGDCIVAYGVTEPGAGSDVAGIKTKADPVTDDSGNITGYKINGTKQFISSGGAADYVTVLAKTPEGPTFFVVEKGTKGYEQGKSEEKHGIRSSQTSPLSFTDVFIPTENLIGEEPGKGLKQANMVFGYTRLMVAAMGLGAGEAAVEIAIPYAKERVVSGSALSEKQGYTHKLIVPNAVRLTAGAAYIEEIAERLDSREKDLQVEGAIAKYFATEAADKAATDSVQALGGYGYIAEYEVEKIKRDVKITCIYEGTSEIQQNIISTFRWKKTIKSKGEYYRGISAEMKELEETLKDAGCKYYSLAANVVNEATMLVHKNKMTRKQFVMFNLADMMAWVEVGVALARKASRAAKIDHPEFQKLRLMSKIFANETACLVSENIQKILMGCENIEPNMVSEFLEQVQVSELAGSFQGVINDMDIVADILFER